MSAGKPPSSAPDPPPYRITPGILERTEKTGEALGALRVLRTGASRPELHRLQRIWTIQSTLEIEGNTLTLG